ncbi:hypothetical protein BCF11_4214 [Collimonas sp. PA-H2]|nr:hypothetical protein BCF11_4214 [Collimonas sp. PA-H2]
MGGYREWPDSGLYVLLAGVMPAAEMNASFHIRGQR